MNIDNNLEKELDKFFQNILKQFPSKVQLIKKDIYDAFVLVTQNTFLQTFDEYYGNNYDINSLLASLQFYTGKDIRPDFSYDENKFKFNNDNGALVKDGFNFNSRKYASFGNFQDPEIEALLDQFWEDEENDETTDELEQEDEQDFLITYVDSFFQPVNNIILAETMASKKDVYEEARKRAVQNFNKEYVTQIKPRIYKKYGIKI